MIVRHWTPRDTVAHGRSWEEDAIMPTVFIGIGSNLGDRHGRLAFAREALARSPEEAIRIAGDIGYPVALKIQSAAIAHKTEAGGVLLNVGNDTELRAGFALILERAQRQAVAASIQGILVQEMVSGGIELILGMSRDSQFGPYLMFGLGGIYVEAVKDVCIRVAPVSFSDAVTMIESIRSYPILCGFRGRPPVDIAALAQVIVRLSDLVCDLEPGIAEIDINPLIVNPDSGTIKAADALVVPAGARPGRPGENPPT